jgi:hypothetical protein
VRVPRIGGCLCLLALAVAGCGGDGGTGRAAAVALPATGRAYRMLDGEQRAAIAASCRDRAAATARGLAARELRAIDPGVLRARLDSAYLVIAEQRRPVAEVCRAAIPFVTPGLRISFDGAKDNRDGSFIVETSSDQRLTLSGRVTPNAAGWRVIAAREIAPPARHSAAVGPDGRFRLPAVRLRKIADNTFTITIQAPPHAPRKVLFSAICLDCLAGGRPPNAQQ